MKFSEYLIERDEEMAFYVLGQSFQNEGLLRGVKSIWSIARGRKYNQGDAKSAMNTANLIANLPDIGAAGKGLLDMIRTLGAGAAVSLGGGDMNYKPPEPVPQVRAYVPLSIGKARRREDDDSGASSYDIFRNAKASREALRTADPETASREADREAEEMRVNRFARAQAFARQYGRRKGDFNLDFIDQTPSA